MEIWQRMKSWLPWSRRQAREADLDRELQTHIELEAEEQSESGTPAEESQYAARRALGNTTQIKEDVRATWGFQWLETLLQDVRYGLRQLRRNPGFTAVAILTLALGIGATTAIFSVVNGVLLKPLPYPHPNDLVSVRLAAPGINMSNLGISPATYFICREQSRTFQDIGLYAINSVNVSGLAEPDHVRALHVTDGVLPILGVPPMLGRWFNRADDSPGSRGTVILSYGYWRSRFGGDHLVIGRNIRIDGKPREIIGVLPRRFRFLDQPAPPLILPWEVDRAKTFLGNFSFQAIARLKPGDSLPMATADLGRMLPIVLRSFPPPPGVSLKEFENLQLKPNLRPLKQELVGDLGSVLWVLVGGISLVMFIAFANVANLLLAKAEGRQHELAVRAVLGATRGRIAAQLLLESLVLALFGSALGLAIAYWALRVLIFMAPQGLPRLNEVGIDGTVLVFTFGVGILATLLFGSVLTLRYTVKRPGDGLREVGRSLTQSRQRHLARNTLVVVQVALAMVLLVGSGLMIRTFEALTEVQPGFVAPGKVQTFRLFFPEADIKSPENVVDTQEDILRKIEAIPSVSAASISTGIPMDGSLSTDPVFVKDRTYASGQIPPISGFEFVSPGFFKTVGTPLIVGRDFSWSDIYNKIPVAIISENLAQEYWHNPRAALGNEIRVNSDDNWREIVGVVGDVYENGTDKNAPNSVYLPLLTARFEGRRIQAPRAVAFAIRAPSAGTKNLINEIRHSVWSVAPDLPVTDIHTLEYFYKKSMARTSFTLTMLGLAGGMALLIGIVGLYAVISYSVAQRTHEIGIRMALGAQKRDMLALVLSGGMSLTVIGVGLGIAAALALTRFLSGMLYGVKPTDPLTFITVSLILLCVALLACYIPARRAAKVDPMVALRHE